MTHGPAWSTRALAADLVACSVILTLTCLSASLTVRPRRTLVSAPGQRKRDKREDKIHLVKGNEINMKIRYTWSK